MVLAQPENTFLAISRIPKQSCAKFYLGNKRKSNRMKKNKSKFSSGITILNKNMNVDIQQKERVEKRLKR